MSRNMTHHTDTPQAESTATGAPQDPTNGGDNNQDDWSPSHYLQLYQGDEVIT
jgi:hypothetical protein